MGDKQLRQMVMDELDYEPSIDAADIGVAAEGGVITLSGHVRSYAEKLAAEDAALRVHGVRGVADEIEIRFPNAPKTADDEIAKRALDILAWDSLVPADQLQVTVSNGYLTLTGTVDWHYQRAAAESAVRKLSHIVGIENKIELKAKINVFDIKEKIESALKRNAETEARNIRVSIEGRDTVKLEGKVDNWSERMAVKTAAWSAPGVRSVVDHLVVG